MLNLLTRKIRLIASLMLIAFAALISSASAYKVSPLNVQLTHAGQGAVSYVTIDNTHDYPLTVEMTVERRVIESGENVEDIPADADFLIFPPQAIVAPRKKQRVQVRYVGQPLESSEFYRLNVKQVPVDISEEGKAKVDVAFNFLAAVYVSPEDAKAEVIVTSIDNADGGYAVSLENTGNKHAVLSSYTWSATSTSGESAAIDTGSFELGKKPMLEPKGTRTIIVPKASLGELVDLTALSLTAPTR